MIAALEFSFSSPVVLEPGTYWLGVHEGEWGSASDGTQLWWEGGQTGIGGQTLWHDNTPTDPEAGWTAGLGYDSIFTIEAVKNGQADACVSAGNTGALMAMSKFCLRTMATIDRPAIAAIWPTMRGESVVLDVGATIGADAHQLIDFAILGAAMSRALFGMERPSVGLLNVGSEDMKGNDAVKGAAHILRNSSLTMEYAGFVEGDDISEGEVDVIVTDGFSGNIALKTAEGTAKLIIEYLRAALTSSIFGKLGALIASGAVNSLKRKLDPRSANGGIFLGLNGVVVKSHGGTDALGFASALDMAIGMAKSGVIPRIAADRAGITPQPAATAVS